MAPSLKSSKELFLPTERDRVRIGTTPPTSLSLNCRLGRGSPANCMVVGSILCVQLRGQGTSTNRFLMEVLLYTTAIAVICGPSKNRYAISSSKQARLAEAVSGWLLRCATYPLVDLNECAIYERDLVEGVAMAGCIRESSTRIWTRLRTSLRNKPPGARVKNLLVKGESTIARLHLGAP